MRFIFEDFVQVDEIRMMQFPHDPNFIVDLQLRYAKPKWILLFLWDHERTTFFLGMPLPQSALHPTSFWLNRPNEIEPKMGYTDAKLP